MKKHLASVSTLGLILFSIFLTGCDSKALKNLRSSTHTAWKKTSESLGSKNNPLTGQTRFSKPEKNIKTEITTRPSAAYIEINGEYVGDSPLTINWEKLYQKYPKISESEIVVIKAYQPNRPTFYTRQRTLRKKAQEGEARFPPRKIYLDLGMQPIEKGEEE